MSWLREAINSPTTGKASSSRVVALAAGLTLSASTLALIPLAYLKPDMVAPLTVFGGALAGLAGANYVSNRMTQEPKHD